MGLQPTMKRLHESCIVSIIDSASLQTLCINLISGQILARSLNLVAFWTCAILKMSFDRLNFTLENLDVSCPAYNYFQQCLTEMCQDRKKFVVEQINTSLLPQYFQYERNKYLVGTLAFFRCRFFLKLSPAFSG